RGVGQNAVQELRPLNWRREIDALLLTEMTCSFDGEPDVQLASSFWVGIVVFKNRQERTDANFGYAAVANDNADAVKRFVKERAWSELANLPIECGKHELPHPLPIRHHCLRLLHTVSVNRVSESTGAPLSVG